MQNELKSGLETAKDCSIAGDSRAAASESKNVFSAARHAQVTDALTEECCRGHPCDSRTFQLAELGRRLLRLEAPTVAAENNRGKLAAEAKAA